MLEHNKGTAFGVTAAGRRFATAAVPLLVHATAARETARTTPEPDAGAVTVEGFGNEPMMMMMYNPDLDGDWMAPFWLGDVRPRAVGTPGRARHVAHDHAWDA